MTTKKEAELNVSKAIIKDFTKLKNKILEGKYDEFYDNVKHKKLSFRNIKKFIREEQKKS